MPKNPSTAAKVIYTLKVKLLDLAPPAPLFWRSVEV